jgi:hypothetical protein
MANKTYAGIGSRETPQEHLYILRDAAKYLAERGYTLRSGGADGSDFFCEKGCDLGGGKKEIYLPWRDFNGNGSDLYPDNLSNFFKAKEIAAKYHPAWSRLRDSVKKLMGRNTYQILGKNLDNPVDFVLCYCPIENGEWKGGTAQALRIAKDKGIKIINIFLEEHKKRIMEKIYKE